MSRSAVIYFLAFSSEEWEKNRFKENSNIEQKIEIAMCFVSVGAGTVSTAFLRRIHQIVLAHK